MATVDDLIVIPSDKRCVMCGRMAALLWTLNNQARASVTYLCSDHGKPLMDIMDAAGEVPPDDQIPIPDRVPEEEPKHQSKLVPLLDWQPGEWSPRMPPKPRPGDENKGPSPEEKLVAASRAEGKTWQEIAEVLGVTRQSVWFKYHQKYGARGARREAVS